MSEQQKQGGEASPGVGEGERRLFAYSVCAGAEDRRVRRHSGTLEEIHGWLEGHSRVFASKDGPLFHPAVYTPVPHPHPRSKVFGQVGDWRVREGIEAIGWLPIDIDDTLEVSDVPGWLERWSGWAYLAYTSWSWGLAECKARLRVLLPLERPVTLSEWAGLAAWARRYAAEGVEGVTGDQLLGKEINNPNLGYYTPRAQNPESFDAGWVRLHRPEGDGARLLDPDDLPPATSVTAEVARIRQEAEARTAQRRAAARSAYGGGGTPDPDDTARWVEDMLGHVPPEDYHEWIQVLQALHAWDPHRGLRLAHAWSSESDKYDPAVLDKKWAGFAEGRGRTLGTLYHLACQYGWEPSAEQRLAFQSDADLLGSPSRVEMAGATPVGPEPPWTALPPPHARPVGTRDDRTGDRVSSASGGGGGEPPRHPPGGSAGGSGGGGGGGGGRGDDDPEAEGDPEDDPEGHHSEGRRGEEGRDDDCDPTQALLDLLEQGRMGLDGEALATWIEEVSAAAVRAFPTWSPFEVEGWRERLGTGLDAGGASGAKRLASRMLKLAAQAQRDATGPRTRAGDAASGDLCDEAILNAWPYAQVEAEARFPVGWCGEAVEVAQQGGGRLWRRQTRRSRDGGQEELLIPVALGPILITGRQREITTGEEHVRLGWRRDRAWAERIVSRETISSQRDLVALSRWGAPVNSTNAGEIVRYLSAYEAENLPNLPLARVSSQLGWQGPPAQGAGFLWGETFIEGDVQDGDGDEAALQVHFHGADEGDVQAAAGYRQHGTWVGWCEAIAHLIPHARPRMALYASLTTPLLPILGAPNFIVDLSYPTSHGKTTALRAAASCWGVPDEDKPDAVISTWDSTTVGVERQSALRQGMPLILDDTQRVLDEPKRLRKVIYDVAQGRGKARGSIGGLARVSTWSTVLLSSGETPIVVLTSQGGVRSRVVTLYGATFPPREPELVQIIREGVTTHFGHAGPMLVNAIMERRDQWPAWRRRYRELTHHYQRAADGDPVGSRLATYLATIDLLGELVHGEVEGTRALLDLPWEWRSPVEELHADLIQEAGGADPALAIASYMMSWAEENRAALYSRVNAKPRPPNRAWLGRWDAPPEPLHVLTKVWVDTLRQAGWERSFIDGATRTLSERGIILHPEKGRHCARVRIDGDRPRCYTLSIAALCEALGEAIPTVEDDDVPI